MMGSHLSGNMCTLLVSLLLVQTDREWLLGIGVIKRYLRYQPAILPRIEVINLFINSLFPGFDKKSCRALLTKMHQITQDSTYVGAQLICSIVCFCELRRVYSV